MARFECTRCGKCCTSFGEFIRIERQLTDRDYYCRDGTTREIFLAHTQPEFADAIAERFQEQGEIGNGSSRKGCKFMCNDPDGKGFACAIYPSRPNICRTFKCYRMIICHQQSGEIRGRVIGAKEIRTQDGVLLALWRDHIAILPYPGVTLQGQKQDPKEQNCRPPTGRGSLVNAQIRGIDNPDDGEWVKNVLAVLSAHGYRGELVE